MILAHIQQQMVELLKQDSWLCERRIGILAGNGSTPADEAERTSLEQGISALVLTTTFTPKSKAGKTIVGEADITVQIKEDPAVNRATACYATALDAAEYIATRYNMEPLPDVGFLVCKSIATPIGETPSLVYSVTFTVTTTLHLNIN